MTDENPDYPELRRQYYGLYCGHLVAAQGDLELFMRDQQAAGNLPEDVSALGTSSTHKLVCRVLTTIANREEDEHRRTSALTIVMEINHRFSV